MSPSADLKDAFDTMGDTVTIPAASSIIRQGRRRNRVRWAAAAAGIAVVAAAAVTVAVLPEPAPGDEISVAGPSGTSAQPGPEVAIPGVVAPIGDVPTTLAQAKARHVKLPKVTDKPAPVPSTGPRVTLANGTTTAWMEPAVQGVFGDQEQNSDRPKSPGYEPPILCIQNDGQPKNCILAVSGNGNAGRMSDAIGQSNGWGIAVISGPISSAVANSNGKDADVRLYNLDFGYVLITYDAQQNPSMEPPSTVFGERNLWSIRAFSPDGQLVGYQYNHQE